jgi:hypothetical protein
MRVNSVRQSGWRPRRLKVPGCAPAGGETDRRGTASAMLSPAPVAIPGCCPDPFLRSQVVVTPPGALPLATW